MEIVTIQGKTATYDPATTYAYPIVEQNTICVGKLNMQSFIDYFQGPEGIENTRATYLGCTEFERLLKHKEQGKPAVQHYTFIPNYTQVQNALPFVRNTRLFLEQLLTLEKLTFKGKTVTYDPTLCYGIAVEHGTTVGTSTINLKRFIARFDAQPNGEELIRILFDICKENYDFFKQNIHGSVAEGCMAMSLVPEATMQQTMQELHNTCRVLEQLLE
ncbi:MAG: hypothetical protein Q7R96_02125 [Nanoarchaeota archaeon]|nr:hypothetical protein [Nanoarchaeota archaeon]